MMLIRPIAHSDLDALYQLAQHTGVGVTTLPANAELLAERIELSEKSFAQRLPRERANYLFALEDTDIGRIVGVSAIDAYVGADDVWYNYRVSKSVNASKEIGVHTTNLTLYLTNDLTGCSEVCTLFLHPEYRHGQNGRMLSKCRFLFMRNHAELFSDKVIAEMRGYSDADGRSPFWEALGRKFFAMDFSRADYLSGLGNKSFVAELMPKYPIYLSFLDAEAQRLVGEVHDNTRPALEMLKREGFNFNGFVDIFDAGPIVECFVQNVRAVRESTMRHTLIAQHAPQAHEDSEYYLVSNCSAENFRASLVTREAVTYDTVSLSGEHANAMHVGMEDSLRVIPLRYKDTHQ